MRAQISVRPRRPRVCQPGVEACEKRELMAADTLGVFAQQVGEVATPNGSASQPIVLDRAGFRTAQAGTVLMRITSDDLTHLGPLSLNTTQNPVHGRPVPSVWQRSSGPGFLLAHARLGSYVLATGYGSTGLPTRSTVRYQLAGDVDGSFVVTHDDLALIRTAMRNPASLSPAERANADVDGNGTVNLADLKLARSNFGAATTIRPLMVTAGISDQTPHSGNVIRVANGVLRAQTTPGARVIFADPVQGQQVVTTADAQGIAQATLPFPDETVRSIRVLVQDRSFGQSASQTLSVERRPTPVVIVPGYMNTLPRQGDLQSLMNFTLNIGVPADQLAVMPAWAAQYGVINTYLNLQQTLASQGYVEGVDQFLVPYDWRLPIAPYDGMQDGVLSQVTGASITQDQPQYSLGYLGNFLKTMVLDDPSIVAIDLVGHSNGGLMTRAYIQSLAYGATVTEQGRTFTLPKVEDVVLLAAPSLGAAEAFPIWNNDLEVFSLSPSVQILRQLLNLPYQAVVAGQTITSPLGNINLAAITDPGTGQPDPLKFLRLYGASLRDLLPTYNFLDTTGGQLTNINSDPMSANFTVLDLNATSSPGVNPWTGLVDSATATFGVHPAPGGTPVPTVTFNQTVVGNGTTGAIWPFQEPSPIVPPLGTVYYNDITAPFGDGTVPYISQIATYANDPSIVVAQWGNGTPQTPPSWIQTIGAVEHSPYLNNSDVLEFVRKRLRGLPV